MTKTTGYLLVAIPSLILFFALMCVSVNANGGEWVNMDVVCKAEKGNVMRLLHVIERGAKLSELKELHFSTREIVNHCQSYTSKKNMRIYKAALKRISAEISQVNTKNICQMRKRDGTCLIYVQENLN